MDEFYRKFGLRKVINARGPATTLGSSRVSEKVRRDIYEMLGRSVEMWELQRKASEAIARLTGAEAGCVVGCSAAGMAVTAAAALTGGNMGWVKALPTVLGPRRKIVIQKGHIISVGDSSISQVVRMTGAEVVEAGEALDCSKFYLEAALTDDVAAAMYVMGDKFPPNLLQLEPFIEICKSRNVPVIIDAAYITDFRYLHELGADLVVHSGQKWLGGATAGLIAGKKELVHACYMNDMGIGRPMKVGKEGVIGVISAIESWLTRDREAIFAAQMRSFEHFQERIRHLPGMSLTVRRTIQSPSVRAELAVDEQAAGVEAWELIFKFAKHDPVIKVDENGVDQGRMTFDLTYLEEEEIDIIAATIERIIDDKRHHRNELKARPERLTRMDALYQTHGKWLDANPRHYE